MQAGRGAMRARYVLDVTATTSALSSPVLGQIACDHGLHAGLPAHLDRVHTIGVSTGAPTRATDASGSSSSAIDDARLARGSMLAERDRIKGPIGKGGE